jgi:hypothetical protein
MPSTAKLDRLFVEQYGTSKYEFLAQFPDATGLVGLNTRRETSRASTFLISMTSPDSRGRRSSASASCWMSGTEMAPWAFPATMMAALLSSWYVLSAMGFYPVCPGSPVYEIGSPIFARHHRPNGQRERLRYRRSITFQRRTSTFNRPSSMANRSTSRGSRHAEIAGGGTLILEMGDKPNQQLGKRTRSDAPPSMSTEHSGAE